MVRLSTRCLSNVSAYDSSIGNAETFDAAQAKFDDIISSRSVDVEREKIKSFTEAKELDSSLILLNLINSAWAKAKKSTTMKNEIYNVSIMQGHKEHHPEEQCSKCVGNSFSPGDGHLYTVPRTSCITELRSCLMHIV